MSSFKGDKSTPSGLLGLLVTGADPDVVGQVAMATDHGGRPSAPTNTAGQPLGGRMFQAGENERKEVANGSVVPLGKGEGCEVKVGAPYGMRNVESDWGESTA